MKPILLIMLFLMPGCPLRAQVRDLRSPEVKLPGYYYKMLESGARNIEEIFKENPDTDLDALKNMPGGLHFPSSILVPAVLFARQHPENKMYGNDRMVKLAFRIGDMLVKENRKGLYETRLDSDWDTYMWLEAYRLLEKELGDERKKLWQEALLDNLSLLLPRLEKYKDCPRYNAPFIITSPNHYAIYASTLLVAGHVFGNAEWIRKSSDVLHRFAVSEQSPDGFWGEHSQAGPTTGYDYLTSTQIGLYWEYSGDPAALEALRRSLDFHEYFTYPDGTPVETINDRNRYWDVSMWGHFGFSNFPDGRRYAEFLTGFFREDKDIQSLSRLAQNALYYHEGKTEPIPQDRPEFVHTMIIPAGVRKTGPWMVCLSGLIAPKDLLNNFFLDRQGNMSIFNAKTGLIITGANSKNQPELATFTERMGGQVVHMPLTSVLSMGQDTDRLALSYHTFFAEIEVVEPYAGRLELIIRTTYKWGDASSGLNLQLVMKQGQPLVYGAGKQIIPGQDPIQLSGAEIGSLIRHNGWTLGIPPGATLTWPVYPFNPYANGPETKLDNAVALLSIPLSAKNEEFRFILEAE